MSNSPHEMSRIQKFFTRIFPKSWAESMEADSRLWTMKCGNCGYEQSYWDMGGIRWKATGNQRTLRTCPSCHQRNWHTSYKKQESA